MDQCDWAEWQEEHVLEDHWELMKRRTERREVFAWLAFFFAVPAIPFYVLAGRFGSEGAPASWAELGLMVSGLIAHAGWLLAVGMWVNRKNRADRDAFSSWREAIEKRYPDAIATLKATLVIQTDYAHTHTDFTSLEGAYSAARYRKRAIASCKAAIALRPNDADAYCNMGLVYADMAWYPKAIAAYQAAVQSNPKHAAGHYKMGLEIRGRST